MCRILVGVSLEKILNDKCMCLYIEVFLGLILFLFFFSYVKKYIPETFSDQG